MGGAPRQSGACVRALRHVSARACDTCRYQHVFFYPVMALGRWNLCAPPRPRPACAQALSLPLRARARGWPWTLWCPRGCRHRAARG